MKQKINKDIVPNDFTLGLAIFDGLPVISFMSSMIIISALFTSKLFIIGAVLCLFAGLSKVLWKIIVVLKKKNIWFLFIQMRISMPIGFLFMIVSLIINRSNINIALILKAILSMPAVIFFAIGIFNMVLMLIFAFCLDNKQLKNNWLEQIVNLIAQLCFLIGIILIIAK